CVNSLALDESNSGRTSQQGFVDLNASFLSSQLEQGVLGDGVGDILTQRATQLGGLNHGQTAVFGQHGGVSFLDAYLELLYRCSVIWIFYPLASFLMFWCTCVRAPAIETKHPLAHRQSVPYSQGARVHLWNRGSLALC